MVFTPNIDRIVDEHYAAGSDEAEKAWDAFKADIIDKFFERFNNISDTTACALLADRFAEMLKEDFGANEDAEKVLADCETQIRDALDDEKEDKYRQAHAWTM